MCVFHVNSETDSFDKFLIETKLETYQMVHKGDILGTINPKVSAYNSFSCNVSDKEWTDLDGQVEDAYNYLQDNLEIFKRLRADYPQTEIKLDFPYACRLGNGICMQGEYLPSRFIKLAGELEIAIALSHYPPCDCDEDNEQTNLDLK